MEIVLSFFLLVAIVVIVLCVRSLNAQDKEISRLKNMCIYHEREIINLKCHQEEIVSDRVREVSRFHRESQERFVQLTEFEDEHFEEFIRHKYKKEIEGGKTLDEIIFGIRLMKNLEYMNRFPEQDYPMEHKD